MRLSVVLFFTLSILVPFFSGCSSIDIVESPRTVYLPDTGEAKDPEIIWTSRFTTQNFDYLGQVNVRSWSYEGALERLIEGGKQLKADAIIDVHFETVGFLSVLHAFAIKFKS